LEGSARRTEERAGTKYDVEYDVKDDAKDDFDTVCDMKRYDVDDEVAVDHCYKENGLMVGKRPLTRSALSRLGFLL
jgi:hypothetical protein